eukprot:96900_1
MTNTTELFLLVTMLILYVVFALPFTVFCLHKVWTNRNEIYIQKRHPLVVLIVLLEMMTQMGLISPLATLSMLLNNQTILDQIIVVAAYWLYFVENSFLSIRIYLTYFDHKYAQRLQEIE